MACGVHSFDTGRCHQERPIAREWMPPWPSPFGCPLSGCDETLLAAARAKVSRRDCVWEGVAVELHILAEPKGPGFTGMGEQTRSWLKAATHRGGRIRGMACSSSKNPSRSKDGDSGPVPLVVSDFRVFHLRVDMPGALGMHGMTRDMTAGVKRRLCAHYTLLGRLMVELHAKGRPAPVALLNYGAEWPGASYIYEVERMLASCGVDPSRTILLHYNLGALLPFELRQASLAPHQYAETQWSPVLEWMKRLGPLGLASQSSSRVPRLRQAFWNHYLAETLIQAGTSTDARRHVSTYRLCNQSRPIRARLEANLLRMTERGEADFLMLGGRNAIERGLAILEMARRGLLTHGRWSAGRFPYCEASVEPSQRQRCDPRSCLDASHPAHPGAHRLLQDATLVRSVCEQLPKKLDVDPSVKSAFTEFHAPHSLWRGTRFAVTFDTSIEDGSATDSLVFTTEKALKPLLNLRPLVMLGSAGALATLRALGFRTFAQTINETYDDVLHAGTRVSAAIDEVSRLVGLPREAWRPLIDAVAHNQRHLLCGGMRRQLAIHALHALNLAVALARSGLQPFTSPRSHLVHAAVRGMDRCGSHRIRARTVLGDMHFS